MYHSSRLEWVMARNLTRSSSGCDWSRASPSTRSLNASQDSSRFRYSAGSSSGGPVLAAVSSAGSSVVNNSASIGAYYTGKHCSPGQPPRPNNGEPEKRAGSFWHFWRSLSFCALRRALARGWGPTTLLPLSSVTGSSRVSVIGISGRIRRPPPGRQADPPPPPGEDGLGRGRVRFGNLWVCRATP